MASAIPEIQWPVQTDRLPPWYFGLYNVDGIGSETMNDETINSHLQAGYNVITSPITTPTFLTSVEHLLENHYSTSLSADVGDGDPPLPIVPTLTPADTFLKPIHQAHSLVAVTSDWIDLCSPVPVISSVSRQIFGMEAAYAAFCGIQTLLVPGPYLPDGSICRAGLAQFARAVYEVLFSSQFVHVMITLPMYPGKMGLSLESSFGGPRGSRHLSRYANMFRKGKDKDVDEDVEVWDAWEAWNVVRSFCKYSTRITVALQVPRMLPPPEIQSRWYSEPLRAIILPDSIFLPNKYSQPVLSKSHQALLGRFMRLRHALWIFVHDVGDLPPGGSYQAMEPLGSDIKDAISHKIAADRTPHLSYLHSLQRKQPPKSPLERFSGGYHDYPQMPLQPLADNLESATYEGFEQDPIKYEWYEKAMSFYLMDWHNSKSVSGPDGKVVIAVVGAGRGPLVNRALRAVLNTDANVEIWAVEKNPQAYVLLQHHNAHVWNNAVRVVKRDMRSWKGPDRGDGTFGKVDILVSELLGSFGDNELSPECLDGVQHVLNPVHGVSIPSSYTSWLTPIASPKLHADLATKGSELPYVVMLHAYDFLAYTPKPAVKGDSNSEKDRRAEQALLDPPLVFKNPTVLKCWEFSHPQPAAVMRQAALRKGGSAEGGAGGPTGGDGANAHNARFAQLKFFCPNRGVCHGLAGYFEAVLFSHEGDEEDSDEDDINVELSINPNTMDAKSKDMISWFPIYFPLRVEVSFPDSTELVVSIWRQTDDRKVWYEWIVEAFLISKSKEGDKRVFLSSTELHSSTKNGCLM